MSNSPNITPEIPQLGPMRVQVRKHALMNEISTRPSRRWWRVAVPATGLAAAAVAATVLWAPTNPSAYASWTAEPRAPGKEETQSAVDECRNRITKLSEHAEGGGRPPTEAMLVDQRGDLTLVLLAGPETSATCLKTPVYTMWGMGHAVQPGETRIRVIGSGKFDAGGEPARVLTGQVAPGVARARVDTTDGRQVTATISNGWIGAWWPSDADATSVTLFDGAGNVVGTVTPESR